MIEVSYNGADLLNVQEDIRRQLAERLLRTAVYYQTQHKQRLSQPNPPPHDNSSVPGEYPKVRTGFGRNSVVYQPDTVEAVARKLEIKVGYLVNASYMAILETARNRLGLLQSTDDLAQQLKAIAESP